MSKYSDEQIYDWLEQNEHSIEGNSYDGYEIVTVWGTYSGPSIRAVMSHVLDVELSYEESQQMAFDLS